MMKQRIRTALILAMVCALAIGTACAEFDVNQYSYEELVEIRQQVSDRLEELDRQYAIEHADRTITFEDPEKVIYLKQSATQTPTVMIIKEEAPASTSFVWSSSDPEIARVNERGQVTAMAAGDAVITATARDNQYISGSYTVHAAVPVGQITIWGPEEALMLDDNPEHATAELTYSIEPEDAYFQDVTWETSNEEIVTVDENGTITGLRPGKAEITAVSATEPVNGKNRVKGTCTIVVKQAVTELEMPQTSLQMNAGGKYRLNVTALPENASDRTVTFTSSDPEVATVDATGVVTAHECGECDIICNATGGVEITGTCHVTVTKVITAITPSETTVVLAPGGTRTIEVEITPEDATRQDIVWTSSNVFVARVAGGKIEAISEGECEITCTALDGSDMTATITVRVPTFSVDETAYTVTEKSGMVIPIRISKPEYTVLASTDATCFQVEQTGSDQIIIVPVSAGKGTVRLENPDVPEDNIEIQITIENSAVYDQVSYPLLKYKAVTKNPGIYEDSQGSIKGKILQFNEEGDGMVSFVIGTAGKKYTDQVFLIQSPEEILPEETAAGDMITVYGVFRMESMYSEALEAETLIPAIHAEKIVRE